MNETEPLFFSNLRKGERAGIAVVRVVSTQLPELKLLTHVERVALDADLAGWAEAEKIGLETGNL